MRGTKLALDAGWALLAYELQVFLFRYSSHRVRKGITLPRTRHKLELIQSELVEPEPQPFHNI